MPSYIIEAIAFVINHINNSTKATSAKYRLNLIKENAKDPLHETARRIDIRDKSEEEIIQLFKTTFPDDQLTKLLNLL